ncbi:DUF2333 family protein [Hoeflea prorocentri]|uniref:DUF2333 family protein n=1 Tax=Hoeflea prorocentri TaxID=1922333 RepID=A0A9X3ZFC8_9HYPH|nr:DUF2333 family protein [Hoeflea prorocentri]MCY6379512.1 DUF2333 family protein [Hoeflea prorocentri]MDA5397312.1 DUF2333 family protein [Hoeflea prorocentri]
MFDPIIAFFERVFTLIGHGIGVVIAWILWPFMVAGRWYRSKGFILKAIVGAAVVGLVVLYAIFIWRTLWIRDFNPDYVAVYNLDEAGVKAGDQPSIENSSATTRTCSRSVIVDVTADLIDFNVDQNAWISSTLLYKAGFFGVPWDSTPFLDNKASFQRGVHQAVQRTAIELVDTLGRVRGTSQVDPDLDRARGRIQYDQYTWYFSLSPFGPLAPTPAAFREGRDKLRAFNDRLESCDAVFDARADNLISFIDRIAKDIGSTSAALRDRSAASNAGWFDTRADNQFWFTYGQLYAYYGILKAAHADFADVIESRQLEDVWTTMEDQLRKTLDLNPVIVSNGREDGWIMPSHLATVGFYLLRVRSNLVEVRSILDR